MFFGFAYVRAEARTRQRSQASNPGVLLAAETIDDARIEPNVLHLRRAPKGGQPIPWLYTRSKSGTQVVVNRHTKRQAEIDPLAP